jgi:hypothetical protein
VDPDSCATINTGGNAGNHASALISEKKPPFVGAESHLPTHPRVCAFRKTLRHRDWARLMFAAIASDHDSGRPSLRASRLRRAG